MGTKQGNKPKKGKKYYTRTRRNTTSHHDYPEKLTQREENI